MKMKADRVEIGVFITAMGEHYDIKVIDDSRSNSMNFSFTIEEMYENRSLVREVLERHIHDYIYVYRKLLEAVKDSRDSVEVTVEMTSENVYRVFFYDDIVDVEYALLFNANIDFIEDYNNKLYTTLDALSDKSMRRLIIQ